MNPFLEHLAEEHPAGCLTLYIPAGPGFDRHYYDTQLKDHEEEALDRDGGQDLDGIMREFAAVRRWFADSLDHRPTGMALAAFSCAPDDIFEVRWLVEDVLPAAHFQTWFALAPLQEQLAKHPPTLVLLTENDQARLFSVVLENVRELGEVESRPLNDGPRGRDTTFEKRELESKHLDAKQAVDSLLKPRLLQMFDTVCLAGPPEARAKVKDELPP